MNLGTIYIGGGTPSILPIGAIERILNAIYKMYRVKYDAEITLEANPDDLSLKKLTALKKLGINPKSARPEWMVPTLLAIPPVTMRPSITLESGERSEDDLTHKLGDIVRINTETGEYMERVR